jgi:hypothetical protein
MAINKAIEMVAEHSGIAVSDDSQTHTLQQIELTFEALNLRIARLAIALGLSLKDEATVTQVLRHHAVQVPLNERRNVADRREVLRTQSSAERRVSHSWEELRGLLVLRYDAQLHCVKQVGVLAFRKILTQAQDHLMRKGFKRGDDGTVIEQLAEVSHPNRPFAP